MAENVVVPDFDEAPETVVGATPVQEFAFDFPFWEASDIIVDIDDRKLPPDQYSVQGYFIQNNNQVEGGYGSGKVILSSPVTDCKVRINRNVRAKRETVFSRSSPLPMPVLNADLNKQVARQQDMGRVLTRTIQFPIGEVPDPLPRAPCRRETVIAFDVNGDLRVMPIPEAVNRMGGEFSDYGPWSVDDGRLAKDFGGFG